MVKGNGVLVIGNRLVPTLEPPQCQRAIVIRPRKFRIKFNRFVVIGNGGVVIAEAVLVHIAAVDEDKFIFGIKLGGVIEVRQRLRIFFLLDE